jgi:hypothetical protein
VWALRRGFWNFLTTSKYRANRPAVIPVPRDASRPIVAVGLASLYPEIPIPNIRVADHVPADEASWVKSRFYDLQVALYRWFSPMQPGLPSIDPDPQKALAGAYTAAHRRCFPAPVLPPEYVGAVDLGSLAVAGPYACYVERAPDGRYQWDLTQLARYEHHDGLRSLGIRVLFDIDPKAGKLEAVQIDCELGSCKPGTPNWELATRLALCAATTHVSLVRHFNGVHLAAGGPLAIATRNALPASHPLRRLMWPHMYGTQYSNEIVTRGQLSPGGDFETIFSFTHSGTCRLFEETYEQYDITVLDPARDAERRGIVRAGFDTPALSNRLAHFDVMHAHAARYLEIYYASDTALRDDASAVAWVEALERLVPNGIHRLLGEDITRESLARLIAAFIYMAAVEHEILGTGLWNYQMWTHVQPVRVYRSGQREPVDVYQRLVNANLILNVKRAQLMQDFSYLALDERGAAAFRDFQAELRRLQARVEREPFEYWKISPGILEANINA